MLTSLIKKCSLFFLITGLISCGNIDNKLDKQEEKTFSEKDKIYYLNQGKIIASKTFETLSKELSAKIGEDGVSGAIKYCNVNAIELTDSIAELYSVDVKRVSDKIRNPNNRADSIELAAMYSYKERMSKGEQLDPILVQEDGKVRFMAPIILKELCLNCHGEPGINVLEENLEVIQRYYPEDLALNYKTGDLRGIWSIRFNK